MVISIAKDEYPQWLNLSPVTAAGVNFAQSETKVPSRVGESHAIEILACQYGRNKKTTGIGGTGQSDAEHRLQMQITTKGQTAIVALTDPTVVDVSDTSKETIAFDVAETGGGAVSEDNITLHNFAVAGKGFLVATNSFFFGIDSRNPSTNEGQYARILYRFVKVSAEELLAMVAQ